jgi:acyl-CoA synthetase (AMP-forming)/AMP-acid ligase II
VAEVGVAGVPDQRRSEAVKAWVVLREGQEATVDEIRAYCRENMAAYKVPRHVEFRESLPKSTVGKVLRRVLAEEELAGQERPAGRTKPRGAKAPVEPLVETVCLAGAPLASGTGRK